MAERLLRWVFYRLRPVRGWLLLALAAATALVLPLSVVSWRPDLDGLWWVALIAVVIGAWLASRPWPRVLVLLLAMALGGVVAAQWASPFLPAAGRVLAEVGATQRWLAADAPAAQLPWLDLLRTSGWQLTGALRDVMAGDRPLLLRLVAAVLVGSSAYWLSWWLFHGPGIRPWLAVLPVGVLLALTAFFSEGQEVYVLFFLLSLLALVAWGRWYQLQRSWADRGSDAPSDLGLDHSTAVAIMGVVAVVMVLIVPQVVVQPAVNWFWGLARAPWERMEGQVEALFPGMLRGTGGSFVAGSLRQGLPRVHLLGSGPDLQKTEVFRVATNLSGESLTPRWRELTYARYTGQGWRMEDDAELDDVVVPAGRPWLREGDSNLGEDGGVRVEQRVELVQGTARIVLASGDPEAVSSDYRAVLRGPDDAVALQLRSPQRRYVVQSRELFASDDKLRIVIDSKNNQTKYLQLNPNLPQRVYNLAAQIVAPATNPYDQAHLLETYLRTLSYDLNVPLVGDDRDLVDAFLFDIRRGYCDYFASAFVVMARTVGLPARLATGYASGNEIAPGQWVVTAADAHSWPEVYFEGVGWIPFEPTPAQPLLTRPVLPPGAAVAFGLAPQPISALPPSRTVLVAVGLLLFVTLAWLLRRAWRMPQNAAEAYAHVTTWGARVGLPPQPGDTMRAFAAALTRRLAREPNSRPLIGLVQAIVAWCEATVYAPLAERPPAGEQRRLWRQWQRAGGARLGLWLRQKITTWRER